MLKKFKGRINVEENYIMLRNEDKELKIEFIDDEEKCIRLIHEINIDPQDFANKMNHQEKCEEFSNVNEYDKIEEKCCITDAEIEEKVAKCKLLSREEKKKFWEVLKKYRDIFSKKPERLSIHEHELKIQEDKPFIIKTYPIPLKLRDLVTLEMNNLQELGNIRRSNSPYMNPVVTSLKKDGRVSICLDA